MSFAFRNQVTGSITALNGVVQLEVRFHSATKCAMQVGGTFTGTIILEASLDNGATWHAVDVFAPTAPVTEVASVTAPGLWTTSLPLPQLVRARASAWTSGTANVLLVCLPE